MCIWACTVYIQTCRMHWHDKYVLYGIYVHILYNIYTIYTIYYTCGVLYEGVATTGMFSLSRGRREEREEDIDRY